MANEKNFPPRRTITSDPETTRRLGAELGRRVRPGVIVLEGPLGAGKTTFVKGLAEGLGFKAAPREAGSPTFVLAREYPGRIPLVHIDLYRLESIGPDTGDWLCEMFARDAVTAVEWGERAADWLPKDFLKIRLAHEDGGTRSITFEVCGAPASFTVPANKPKGKR
jgi:tRNA threonylcarbamoyladenosine biosynthesis protein TsaE